MAHPARPELHNLTLDETTVDEAIRKALLRHLGDTRLTVRFNVPRERLADNILYALIRIIRELTINSVQHGHATEVKVAGAMMKTADDERIVSAIHRIVAGSTYVSADIQRQLKSNPPVSRLSDRQAEVLQLIVDGRTSKEIATQLGIRSDSVDAVTRSLFEKLGAANRAEAVAIALRKHLLKI